MSANPPQRQRMLLVAAAVAVFGIAMFVLGRSTAPRSDAAPVTTIASAEMTDSVAATTAPISPAEDRTPATVEDPGETFPPGCEPLDYRSVALSDLPFEVEETFRIIADGPPYPYRADGGVFQNREGLLPNRERGYYLEFTVETPGSSDRGARRIVSGECGEFFYTSDHYESFELIDLDR